MTDTNPATLEIGQRVTVIEYDESTRSPRPGGKRYGATVSALGGVYVQVRYDSTVLNAGRPDAFYAESLWRAWDGCLRWRITLAEAAGPEGAQQ